MVKRSGSKDFLMIVGALFGLISFLHLVRAAFQWPMIIGSFSVPIFWSWYLFVATLFFSLVAFSLTKKIK